MKLFRRTLLQHAAGAIAFAATCSTTWAVDYPTRPVRIVVGYPPGLTPDVVVRLVGQPLSERLGQPVVIENRTGAASNIGAEFVVRAPPDGYTLFSAAATNAINTTLYPNLPFDFIRDTAPVAALATGGFVLVVNPSLPVKNHPRVHRLCEG